ncbi:MAG: FAD-dependent oxidoreductase [Spirochaetes bacterium]|nr:FAD-dependent oxidoreductase [Spirochaetota bacterium]
MKPFNHTNAKSVKEAVKELGNGRTTVIAGATDLLGTLKDYVLPDFQYPKTVVNIKSVPGLDFIKEEDGTLKIGAVTRLADIADNQIIKKKYTALAQAACSVATPHVRDMGTIGGNLAQLNRCWYFRKPDNRFNCLRKGGKECFAITGDNRFHSIFGGYKARTTSCTMECPAGTDIPGYMSQIRSGNWDEAAQIIMNVNPMPAITARVCAHFCQNGCNRSNSDESVLISGVERTVGDYIMENSGKFYRVPEKETGKSAAVIGSGPSGLSAAYYLRKAGNKVTVFDSKEEAGGMLMYAIPAYRLPKDLVRRYIKILEDMGIEFRLNTTIGKDIKAKVLEKKYDSVYYATGAWKRPVIGIAGEELTEFGLDFLVEVNKWMEGKIGTEVIVTGGGNVAMDVAVTAKRLGAKKVTLACLEPRDRMPASSEEITRAEEEGIIIMPSWGLSRVVEENGVVKGMELKRCLSPWDKNGSFNPLYDENEKITVNAENILMAVGQKVDLSFLEKKYQMQLNKQGFIDVSEDTQMTSRLGIFAGGDATTGPATVIGAVANGHRAANGMNNFLEVEYRNVYLSTTEKNNKIVRFDPTGVTNTNAFKLKELNSGNRCLDKEDSFTPSMEEADTEARRCFNCGCYAVNISDTAPALIALNAKIVTDKRTIDAEEFFDVKIPGNTVLAIDEIITEIHVPSPPQGSKSVFKKFAFRKTIDFPVVNCAVLTGGESPRICLNAVAPKPYRAFKAEKSIAGKIINEEIAEAAGAAAVAEAQPLKDAGYKIQITKTLVKRALLETIK